MKIVNLQNLKRPVLVCELPEGATATRVAKLFYEDVVAFRPKGSDHDEVIILPPGSWEPLGWLTELKEEQLDGLVELHPGCKMSYRNYTEEPWRVFGSAKESFLSVVEAAGWYWQNPNPHPADIDPVTRWHYEELEENWQTAQKKVLDKERCFVIVKK